MGADGWDAFAVTCGHGATSILVHTQQVDGPICFGLTANPTDDRTFNNGFSVNLDGAEASLQLMNRQRVETRSTLKRTNAATVGGEQSEAATFVLSRTADGTFEV